MSERSRRFRRLGAKAQTGDLFEHFGVDVEPDPGPLPALTPVTQAIACPACGWYRPLRSACDLCGHAAAPSELGEAT